MSVPSLASMSETMKQIYEPLIREQIEKESALLKMMEASITPEQKARMAKAAEEAKKWCHEDLDFGDYYFSCQRKAGHNGKHKHKNEGETYVKKHKVTW